MKRYTLTVTVGTTDTPPENLSEFTKWLADIAAQIPPEHFAAARIVFDCEKDYDGYCYGKTVEVSYERPETDEEMQERYAEEKREREREKEDRERSELATLKRLKAKYENG